MLRRRWYRMRLKVRRPRRRLHHRLGRLTRLHRLRYSTGPVHRRRPFRLARCSQRRNDRMPHRSRSYGPGRSRLHSGRHSVRDRGWSGRARSRRPQLRPTRRMPRLILRLHHSRSRSRWPGRHRIPCRSRHRMYLSRNCRRYPKRRRRGWHHWPPHHRVKLCKLRRRSWPGHALDGAGCGHRCGRNHDRGMCIHEFVYGDIIDRSV